MPYEKSAGLTATGQARAFRQLKAIVATASGKNKGAEVELFKKEKHIERSGRVIWT